MSGLYQYFIVKYLCEYVCPLMFVAEEMCVDAKRVFRATAVVATNETDN